jgi:CheY-like chemotaxis protein
METNSSTPGTCLIAESDRFIAKLLIRYCEELGIACVRAKEGEDILALARQVNPTVLILDAEYPGEMTGWQILRALKADQETRHVALISCSWMSEEEVHSLAGSLVGYLRKPDISFREFERVMRDAVVRVGSG